MDPTTWSEGYAHDPYPPLGGMKTADVVIVGGGLCGVLSAYLIAKAGKKVILLEKGTLGSGMTMCTTAFITQSLDTDPSDLIKIFTKKGAQEILSSHQEALELIEKIIKEEKIECEYSRCSNYIYANSHKDLKTLAEEGEALIDLGIEVKMVENGSDLGIPNAGYIEIKNQAKFHPLKFLLAVAKRAEKYGAQIYENSEALKREKTEAGMQRITTKEGVVEAEWAIIATYKPFNNPLSLFFKKGSYVSYVMELELKGLELKDGTYEDTHNPYHYFRVDGNRVIIGGEDHRQDIPVRASKNFKALREYSDSIIPRGNRTIRRRWSGIILEPVDGIASIGPINTEKVLYALGFSGNGMTYSGIAAMIFRNFVVGKNSDWMAIYHPRRHLKLKALALKFRDYSQELLGGALKNVRK
jgi:glycine/D-amino acid oxidase-like deaminating enzyme